jgi:hypothetical protein
LWRACLAVLAVVANIVLPAAWSLATPLSDLFGENYSICLASGGKIVAIPGDHLPDRPAAAGLHCSLCLFTGIFTSPPGSTGAAAILGYHPAVLSSGYIEPGLAPRFHALKLEARAPPA